jgi:hypothetical protein
MTVPTEAAGAPQDDKPEDLATVGARHLAQDDAAALERAAKILLRRYGLLTAGDMVKVLYNRATAIREGLE